MALPSVTYTLTNGTSADADEVQTNFNDIIGSLTDGSKDITINAVDTQTLVVDSTITLGSSSIDVENSLVPIGSIIPFYDFNGDLTFNSTYWVYCDGSSATIGGSSRTTPDLSNRYLVGFGTEGGGDIDTASWATAVVGEADHEIDISHTHTGPAHQHESLDGYDVGGGVFALAGPGGQQSLGNTTRSNFLRGVATMTWYSSTSVGVTGLQTLLTSSSGTGATSSSLSATQSIQPRSIRVRYIMRAK